MVGIGIDVCKARLDVSVHDQNVRATFDNDRSGHLQLLEFVQRFADAHVLLEATGGFENGVLTCLSEHGIWVCQVNPRQARDFAKSTGQTAKTDALDADDLAFMVVALRERLRPYTPRAPWRIKLSRWVKRRSQVVAQIQQQKRQLMTTEDSALCELMQTTIKAMRAELAAIESQLRKQRQAHVPKALQSMKGLGPVFQTTVLAQLPELGTLSGAQIAKLVGVAPLNHDSGTKHAPRRIWGGRADVRCSLYMATLSAIRWEPIIAAHYQQLRQRGKPGKLALVACMRKVLIILNARCRDELYESSGAQQVVTAM